ncbi:MAG: hypothetical protein Ta2A_07790 [Treponemataceae bacterium]|nr:MAG: hypothetical protein Ta2A_07790 [Treponemataceae bacterium]
MKWTVFGFNQQKLVDYGLDILDAAILRWFVDFYQTDAMVRIPVAGKEDHVWVKFLRIAEDLPTLGFSDVRQIRKRFDKYCEKGVMSKTTSRGNKGLFCGFLMNKQLLDELLRYPHKKNKPTSTLDVSAAELEHLSIEYLSPNSQNIEDTAASLPFDEKNDETDEIPQLAAQLPAQEQKSAVPQEQKSVLAQGQKSALPGSQGQKSALAEGQKSVLALVNSSTKEFKKEAAAADFSAKYTEKTIENLEKAYQNALTVCETLTSSLKDVKNILDLQEQKNAVPEEQKRALPSSQGQKSVLPQGQKNALAKQLQDISPELVFDEKFYDAAAAFLNTNALDASYLQ